MNDDIITGVIKKVDSNTITISTRYGDIILDKDSKYDYNSGDIVILGKNKNKYEIIEYRKKQTEKNNLNIQFVEKYRETTPIIDYAIRQGNYPNKYIYTIKDGQVKWYSNSRDLSEELQDALSTNFLKIINNKLYTCVEYYSEGIHIYEISINSDGSLGKAIDHVIPFPDGYIQSIWRPIIGNYLYLIDDYKFVKIDMDTYTVTNYGSTEISNGYLDRCFVVDNEVRCVYSYGDYEAVRRHIEGNEFMYVTDEIDYPGTPITGFWDDLVTGDGHIFASGLEQSDGTIHLIIKYYDFRHFTSGQFLGYIYS